MRDRPYFTTVIGSYSVPAYYDAMDELWQAGNVGDDAIRDMQDRTSQAAILDQQVAGIDLLTGGELHRRTNNRHAPPNAMLNFFWKKMPGFSPETRPLHMVAQDPTVFHPVVACVGKIEYGDLGLVEEFRFVSANADADSVKITMTGPHMLCKVVADEHYGSMRDMMMDVASVINRNFQELQTAGCRAVQLDEPLFAISPREEVADAIEAINQAFHGVTAHRSLHVCQGNYSMGRDHDGGIGHRYFMGPYPADLIVQANVDAVLVEGDMAPAYKDFLGDKDLGVGAVDVLTTRIESAEEVVEKVRALSWLPPEHTMLNPSCGLNNLSRAVALGKLRALGRAAYRLRSEMGAVAVH
jgi:5-methyltetrahydropteroyltriglutamate--homocysteine methyltransferase